MRTHSYHPGGVEGLWSHWQDHMRRCCQRILNGSVNIPTDDNAHFTDLRNLLNLRDLLCAGRIVECCSCNFTLMILSVFWRPNCVLIFHTYYLLINMCAYIILLTGCTISQLKRYNYQIWDEAWQSPNIYVAVSQSVSIYIYTYSSHSVRQYMQIAVSQSGGIYIFQSVSIYIYQ